MNIKKEGNIINLEQSKKELLVKKIDRKKRGCLIDLSGNNYLNNLKEVKPDIYLDSVNFIKRLPELVEQRRQQVEKVGEYFPSLEDICVTAAEE